MAIAQGISTSQGSSMSSSLDRCLSWPDTSRSEPVRSRQSSMRRDVQALLGEEAAVHVGEAGHAVPVGHAQRGTRVIDFGNVLLDFGNAGRIARQAFGGDLTPGRPGGADGDQVLAGEQAAANRNLEGPFSMRTAAPSPGVPLRGSRRMFPAATVSPSYETVPARPLFAGPPQPVSARQRSKTPAEEAPAARPAAIDRDTCS